MSETAHLYCVDIEFYFGGEATGNQPRRILIRLPLIAHRCNWRRRSNSVAFGAKRTFVELRLQNRI
jgi:hypothetical protein